MMVNGEKYDLQALAPEFTLVALISKFGLSPQRVAVELNGELVPRGRYAEYRLGDNDQVEIIHYVGGG